MDGDGRRHTAPTPRFAGGMLGRKKEKDHFVPVLDTLHAPHARCTLPPAPRARAAASPATSLPFSLCRHTSLPPFRAAARMLPRLPRHTRLLTAPHARCCAHCAATGGCGRWGLVVRTFHQMAAGNTRLFTYLPLALLPAPHTATATISASYSLHHLPPLLSLPSSCCLLLLYNTAPHLPPLASHCFLSSFSSHLCPPPYPPPLILHTLLPCCTAFPSSVRSSLFSPAACPALNTFLHSDTAEGQCHTHTLHTACTYTHTAYTTHAHTHTHLHTLPTHPTHLPLHLYTASSTPPCWEAGRPLGASYHHTTHLYLPHTASSHHSHASFPLSLSASHLSHTLSVSPPPHTTSSLTSHCRVWAFSHLSHTKTLSYTSRTKRENGWAESLWICDRIGTRALYTNAGMTRTLAAQHLSLPTRCAG